MKYAFHPECLKIRPMTDGEFQSLKDNIRENGYDVNFPILLHEGMILDGRHRYLACMELGIEPYVVNWVPAGHDTAYKFVIRTNTRRVLSVGELAAIGINILVKSMQDPDVESVDKPSVSSVARDVGISRKSMIEAKKVREKDPETFDRMASGEISLAEAIDVVETKRPPIPKQVESRDEMTPELKKIFDTRKEFEALCNSLNAIKRELYELSKDSAGRMIRYDTISLDIKNAVEAIRWSMPWRICPYKTCLTGGCKACGGSRWVTKNVWENIPKEIRGE